jgi:hypothetical protein
MDQALEMAKAAREKTGLTDRARIFTSSIGPFNVLVEDIEFENLSETEAFWADWWSDPDTTAFMKKWNDLVASSGGSEIWNVE